MFFLSFSSPFFPFSLLNKLGAQENKMYKILLGKNTKREHRVEHFNQF
jgi:hypothetical protein